MLKRLQWKFVAITMSLVSLMLCILLGFVFCFTIRNLRQDSLSTMRQILLSPPPPASLSEDASPVQLPFFLVEVDENGKLSVTNGSHFELSNQDALQAVVDAALSSGVHEGTLEGYQLRYCWATLPQGTRIVFAGTSFDRDTLAGLFRLCLAVGLAGLAMFFVLSLLLAKWAVRPVADAWSREKQFVADASHELKTPLTVILTNAEMLRRAGVQEHVSERCTEHIHAEALRMRSLVQSLLELARVDKGCDAQAACAVDFSEVTRRQALMFEPVLFELGHPLEASIQEGITIWGSEQHLAQLAEVLLDNAGKYASPGGKIWLTLCMADKHHCLLCVENEGPALEKAQCDMLFQRFYRADSAHASTGSFGLGLAIAKAVTDAHKGTIRAESQNGRTRFTAKLPVYRAGHRLSRKKTK